MRSPRFDRKPLWLVTGGTGLVGRSVAAAGIESGVQVVTTSRSGGRDALSCNLDDEIRVRALLEMVRPDHIIHLAAISKPAAVEAQPEEAFAVNVGSTRTIADWCARNGRHLTFASTDFVFGLGSGPFREGDPARPGTLYGKMKLEAEQFVTASGGLVLRFGWVLDDTASALSDYVSRSIASLRRGAPVSAVDDEWRTPVTNSDLGRLVILLSRLRSTGTVHVAGQVHTTPYLLLQEKARALDLDASLVRPISRAKILPESRPADTRLNTDLLQRLTS